MAEAKKTVSYFKNTGTQLIIINGVSIAPEAVAAVEHDEGHKGVTAAIKGKYLEKSTKAEFDKFTAATDKEKAADESKPEGGDK